VLNKVFYTVTNKPYFLGTVATINSVMHLHKYPTIWVISSANDPLSKEQENFIKNLPNIKYTTINNLDIGRHRNSWETKAHACFYLQKYYQGNHACIVHLDSDLILCSQVHDLCTFALDYNTLIGGKDGEGENYTYAEYKPYFDLCNSKLPRVDHKNKLYMSTSLFAMPVNNKFQEISKLWSEAVDHGKFGPSKTKLYKGHGDQGILNPIIFYKNIRPILIDNEVISEHWIHGNKKIKFFQNKFVKDGKTQIASHSVGSSPKFWADAYYDVNRNSVNKKHKKNVADGNLDVIYSYWLWLLYYGPVGLMTLKDQVDKIFNNRNDREKIFFLHEKYNNKPLLEQNFSTVISNPEIRPYIFNTEDLNNETDKKEHLTQKNYDINICVTFCADKKFAHRIKDFKEYGLCNCKTSNILLTILIEKNHGINDLDKDWPCDVKIIEYDQKEAHKKVYSYYSNLTLEEVGQSKWFMRVDDDSFNDVDKIVEHLSKDFDYSRDYYLASDFCYDADPPFRKILEDMGYSHWFVKKRHKKFEVLHEWEAAIISQSAMKKIINNKNSIELLKKSSQVNSGHCDHCLSFAARICKIYPIDVTWMTHEPIVEEFSLFGGRYAHIHFMQRERSEWSKAMNLFSGAEKDNSYWLKDIVQNPSDVNLEKALADKNYIFGRKKSPERVIISNNFFLNKDRTISGYSNFNEKFWYVKDKTIHILNENEEVTTKLSVKDKNKRYFEGKFIPDNKIIHFLERS